jgi:ubiquinone/menaquinone biosynthesis C-methylase UbiE
MSSNPDELRHQLPSTYAVRDRANPDELTRLRLQDDLVTAEMGGPLPEQANADKFRRILDVGCGTGGWLIEAAKTYPNITRLVGVDVNTYLIDYARKQAEEEGVSDRVEFQVMDALLILEFPRGYFDLVNLRFGTSFMRTWNWPKMISELKRVTYPGGVVRLTEVLRVHSSSPAHIRLLGIIGEALFNAGHLFSQGKVEETFAECTGGIANDLERLLDQYGLHDIQTRVSNVHYRAGTPAGQHYIEDIRLSVKNVIPFVRKWGYLSDDYDVLARQALEEMQQPGYSGHWDVLTAWGTTTL